MARSTSPSRRRLGRLVAAAALATTGVAALPAGATGDAPATEVVADIAAGDHEVFTGTVAEFYEVPDPLPPGEPGELIRVQPVTADATSTTVRIMYHSVDAAGRDRAVTGKLTYPNGPAPDGGWPVTSHAHGTTGMASRCAPSRGSGREHPVGMQGVAVTTDYIGLGPVGELHPYLSRLSEGRSVIDAVRAARDLPAAQAGTRYVVIGGSQGGHGALAANELAATWAPELDLLGTVALAPAAVFGATYNPLDQLVTRVVGAMGFIGATTETDIDPTEYLTPAALAATRSMETGCTTEIAAAVLSVPFDGFWARDPFLTEPARSILHASDVGYTAVDSPVLLVQGTADTTVVPERTRDLFARMCAVGQVVQHIEVEGADHGNVHGRASATIDAWIGDRLAGAPAPSTCDPDPAPPILRAGLGTVVEGDDGTTTVGIPLFLTAPSSEPITVRWGTGYHASLPDQATPGTDYEPTLSSVTVPPGWTEAMVEVEVHGDVEAEADEVFLIAVGAAGLHVRDWGVGGGVILDDD